MSRQKLMMTWEMSAHEYAALHFALWQRQKTEVGKLAALPEKAVRELRRMLEQNVAEAQILLAGLENARRHYVQAEAEERRQAMPTGRQGDPC